MSANLVDESMLSKDKLLLCPTNSHEEFCLLWNEAYHLHLGLSDFKSNINDSAIVGFLIDFFEDLHSNTTYRKCNVIIFCPKYIPQEIPINYYKIVSIVEKYMNKALSARLCKKV
ncbi:MAG: hypothetical protein FWC41_10140 [Firmicutes bacterium]|nr:hypothetical protein [Bacillota bacterium]